MHVIKTISQEHGINLEMCVAPQDNISKPIFFLDVLDSFATPLTLMCLSTTTPHFTSFHTGIEHNHHYRDLAHLFKYASNTNVLNHDGSDDYSNPLTQMHFHRINALNHGSDDCVL